MARPGEIAPIVSKKQFDYFSKQAQAAKGKGTPLDSRGQAHRAARDEEGKVVKPGGGSPDAPPSGGEAEEALLAFYQQGGKRADLPDESPTKNAARKDLEHAKMRKDKVVRPPVRPPGSSEHERNQMRAGGVKNPAKGKWIFYRGKYRYISPTERQASESKLYVSKSIEEDLDQILDQVLGS